MKPFGSEREKERKRCALLPAYLLRAYLVPANRGSVRKGLFQPKRSTIAYIHRSRLAAQRLSSNYVSGFFSRLFSFLPSVLIFSNSHTLTKRSVKLSAIQNHQGMFLVLSSFNSRAMTKRSVKRSALQNHNGALCELFSFNSRALSSAFEI